jgi:hypothetical protein
MTVNDPAVNSEASGDQDSLEGPELTLMGVSHDEGNKSIGQTLIDMLSTHDIAVVEGSIYLGGFIPPEAPADKIKVVLESPKIFFGGDSAVDDLSVLYYNGRAIPDSSRGYRRLFEIIASEIRPAMPRRDLMRIVHELLHLRVTNPDVVIYNEPKMWLRTVWYEADLIFHYIMARQHYKLFGAYIYSDLDAEFASYMEKSAEAISALTADDALLFAFAGPGQSPGLAAASEYVAYRCVMETPGRLENSMTPLQIDEMRLREARMLAPAAGRNRAITFGRKLGVTASQTPCIVFWQSLDDKRFVTLPLTQAADSTNLSAKMKSVADVIASAVTGEENSVLDRLMAGIGEITSQKVESPISEIIRSFLDESSGQIGG